MNEKQKAQRNRAYTRSGGVCVVCGKPLISGQMQYAHKIGNTEINRNKYGSFFIDSTYNGELVCSLGCNSVIDVGKSPGRVLDTLADILIKEIADLRG